MFTSLQYTLDIFLCKKFKSNLNCTINIEEKKTCDEYKITEIIFYKLEMHPENYKDLDNIKNDFQNYIEILKSDNATSWNEEYQELLMENEIDIQIDFFKSINSFNYVSNILNDTNRCNVLSCTNQYFTPICTQNSNFYCDHQCNTGSYCMNNGECYSESSSYKPICK